MWDLVKLFEKLFVSEFQHHEKPVDGEKKATENEVAVESLN